MIPHIWYWTLCLWRLILAKFTACCTPHVIQYIFNPTCLPFGASRRPPTAWTWWCHLSATLLWRRRQTRLSWPPCFPEDPPLCKTEERAMTIARSRTNELFLYNRTCILTRCGPAPRFRIVGTKGPALYTATNVTPLSEYCIHNSYCCDRWST